MQAPMTPDTRHFLSDAEFEAMKTGAILVNTGRGPTVDNQALYRALTEGHLAAAGLDDPEEEPAKRANWSPKDNPIFELPNVLVTPHAAYYSEESIRAARVTAATQVAKVLTGSAIWSDAGEGVGNFGILESATEADARAFAEGDPFYKEGIVRDYTLTRLADGFRAERIQPLTA